MKRKPTVRQRKEIQDYIDNIVEQLSREKNLIPVVVSNIAFLRLQKHPTWGRNATKTQKRESFKLSKEKCYICKKRISFSEAVFHHYKRDIAKQHSYPNLVPLHSDCHDRLHKVKNNSLLKGTPSKNKK